MAKHMLGLLAKAFGMAALIGGGLSLVIYLAGARNAVLYSNGLFLASGILIFIGLFDLMGGYRMRSDFKTVYSQSAGDPNLHQCNQRWMADTLQVYSMLLFFGLIAGFLLAAGILVDRFG